MIQGRQQRTRRHDVRQSGCRLRTDRGASRSTHSPDVPHRGDARANVGAAEPLRLLGRSPPPSSRMGTSSGGRGRRDGRPPNRFARNARAPIDQSGSDPHPRKARHLDPLGNLGSFRRIRSCRPAERSSRWGRSAPPRPSISVAPTKARGGGASPAGLDGAGHRDLPALGLVLDEQALQRGPDAPRRRNAPVAVRAVDDPGWTLIRWMSLRLDEVGQLSPGLTWRTSSNPVTKPEGPPRAK